MHTIVVGGGLAGLVAAARAAEFGARVTLLEKGEWVGGSFVLSSGFVWSYRDMATYRREAPRGDDVLQVLILERLLPALDWLEHRGARVLSRETGNPLTFGARLDPESAVRALSEHVAASGGRIVVGTAMERLEVDGSGRVVGVVAVSGGERRRLRADAVILASGGFAASRDLVGRYIVRGPARMRVRAHPWSTGDGLLAALDAGAATSVGMDEFYGRNLPAPPAEFSPQRFVEVSQLYGRYAVALNARGERFADEAADWSETALAQATARQPNLRAWYILDAGGLRRRVRERSVEQMVETAGRVGGPVLRAGSLEDLAGLLRRRGVDAGVALATLVEYNSAVEAGRSGRLSPPRSDPAVPLQAPPFVAVEVAPAITHTIGGLAVDEGCRVLRRTGGTISGLYAAGVEVGGVSAGGYTSGLASALVLGMVAAESALGDTG